MHVKHTDTQVLGKSLAHAQQLLKNDGYIMVAGLCDPSFVEHLL